MDNLKMHSPNIVEENITRIREMFPHCAIEARDGAGGPPPRRPRRLVESRRGTAGELRGAQRCRSAGNGLRIAGS